MSEISNVTNPDDDLCSICLSALTQPDKDLYTTTCQHRFHFTCLAKNIQAQNNECPLCRTRLESLVNIIQKPVQPPPPPIAPVQNPAPIQTTIPRTSSASSSGLWATLRRSIRNGFNWITGSNTSSQFSSLFDESSQDAFSEDPIDEAAVQALSERIQQARQRVANATTELALIMAITTLEFDGQASNQASNIYGMVTLKAPSVLPISASEKELNELRVPIDIVCIVDRSGSMSGEKINLLKKTLDYIVDQMNPLDRLAIISFDTNAVNQSNGLNKMTPAGKQRFHNRIIQGINSGGGTYIGSGLKMGINMLNSRQTKNPLGAMLLLTDGQDNQYHDYTDLMQTLSQDVVCHTFGYGLGHNAALLSRLAEQGNGGTFTFIDQVASIDLAFATALGSLFTCVAQNLRVKLDFDGQYAVTHSHSIYKHEPVQLPSRQMTFKLHDLNADEKRNLVFQLNVPELTQPSNDNNIIGRVSLEYTDAASNRHIQTPEVPFFLQRPSEIPSDSTLLRVNYALDVQRNRAETSRVLKEAVQESNYELARQLLNNQLAKIRASVSVQDPLCQQLIKDLEYQYSNREQFVTTMTNMYMQHGQERFTHAAATTLSSHCYMTSGQERFRSIVRKS